MSMNDKMMSSDFTGYIKRFWEIRLMNVNKENWIQTI